MMVAKGGEGVKQMLELTDVICGQALPTQIGNRSNPRLGLKTKDLKEAGCFLVHIFGTL